MAQDNYGWLLQLPEPSESGQAQAWVVDVTDHLPIQRALQEKNLTLTAILATHHHHDHVGGIPALLGALPGPIDVVGGRLDVAAGRIPLATVALDDKATWQQGGVRLRALHVPGHTLGSTAYHLPDCDAVFVGDTLFAGGCGRVFEGDPAMMWESLQVLRALPSGTRIYCGHEYTVKNLRFALSLEPGNAQVRSALEQAQTQRQKGVCTVPTRLADEWLYNPFLRADDKRLQQVMGTTGAVATFAALRSARNDFAG